MPTDNKEYFFLAFDLSIDKLQLYYPNRYVNQAWDDIKRFMEKNYFEHNQKSAYISSKKLSKHEIKSIFYAMYKKMPWFPLCADKVMLSLLDSQEKLLDSVVKTKSAKRQIQKLLANPPGQKREDLLLPKKEKQDTSEMSLTPEQYKRLTEAGIKLKVTVDLKDQQKASEILKQEKFIQQENTHRLKR